MPKHDPVSLYSRYFTFMITFDHTKKKNLMKYLLLVVFYIFADVDIRSQEILVDPVPICMVTVDSFSVYNNIYWQKEGLTDIDSFRIYRQTATDVYTWIGSVDFDSLSFYVDTNITGPGNGDPNTHWNRYKISALDNQGIESALSPYHETIYIQDFGGGDLNWNIYGIEGATPDITSYLIFRDATNGASAPIQIWSVGGAIEDWTDPNFNTFPISTPLDYYTSIEWSVTCDPSRAIVVRSRSNIKRSVVTSINKLNTEFRIYPQPAKDKLTINFRIPVNGFTLSISDITGKIINTADIKGNLSQYTLSLDDIPPGIYFLAINNKGKLSYERLIVVRD